MASVWCEWCDIAGEVDSFHRQEIELFWEVVDVNGNDNIDSNSNMFVSGIYDGIRG